MKDQVKKKTIKELAGYFDEELQAQLPITRLTNGSFVYKEFIVKQLPNSNWALYDTILKEIINDYFLKSCALIAAKEYSNRRFDRYSEIKFFDTRYQAAYTDLTVFRNHIKKITDPDQYDIILTRLEESTSQSLIYKKTISRLFRHAFV